MIYGFKILFEISLKVEKFTLCLSLLLPLDMCPFDDTCEDELHVQNFWMWNITRKSSLVSERDGFWKGSHYQLIVNIKE